MMMYNTLAVAWKELQILFKDRGQLVVLFLMPVMFASIIGSAFSGGTPGITIYLVNQDTGRYSSQVINILYQIEALRIIELETTEQADRLVADGEALAAVVFPADFSPKIDAFDRTQIQVIVDPTQQQYGSIITGILNEVLTPVILQGEIQHGIRAVMDESGAFDESDPQTRRMIEAQNLGVIMTSLQEAFENPLIAVQAEDLAGVRSESLDSGHSYTTPSYAVMFAFFIVGTIASSLLREKEEGTLRRLLVSPLHQGSIIAGTMLAYMLLVGLQVLVVFGVGSGFFDIALGDSPLGLLSLTAALAWAATGMGMLVAALARTRSQADGVGVVLGLVMAAVGGAVVPIPEGGFLHLLSQFTPHAHAIEGYLKLTTQGAGLMEVLPQVGLLFGVGILFFAVALWRFKFE
jgi:ABC-2 type transport system permease protein